MKVREVSMKEFEGKKLLILGGNPETVPLIEMANEMGIKTIVTSSVPGEPGKAVAWKGCDVDGMDVPGLVALARDEQVETVAPWDEVIVDSPAYDECSGCGIRQ